MSWYALGLKLGAKEYTLDSIQESHDDDHEKCCREMLLNWLLGKQDSGDCPKTWDDFLHKVESVVGSEASTFIRSNILNRKKGQLEQRPAEGGTFSLSNSFVLSLFFLFFYFLFCVCVWH